MDSQDDGEGVPESDGSSDAEDVFAFHPPTTAERQVTQHQNQDLNRHSPSATYPPSPRPGDVHEPATLPGQHSGPSRFISDIPFGAGLEHYLRANTPVASAPHADINECPTSRPSSRASHRGSSSDVFIAFREPVVLKHDSEKTNSILGVSESTLGFDVDDHESKDGSKECISTLPTVFCSF